MKTESHALMVKSAGPPTVEVDPQAQAVYVRFKKATIAKTVTRPCETMNIAIDLDASGSVIGIEIIGMTEFTIGSILKKADVTAPNVDLSRTRFMMPDDLVAA
jgi:uncharacterized protein YuzE